MSKHQQPEARTNMFWRRSDRPEPLAEPPSPRKAFQTLLARKIPVPFLLVGLGIVAVTGAGIVIVRLLP